MFCAAVTLILLALYLIFGRPFFDNLTLVRKIKAAGGTVQFEAGNPKWLRELVGKDLQHGLGPIVAVELSPWPGRERIVHEVAADLRDRPSIMGLQMDLTDVELGRLNCPQLDAIELYESTTDAGLAELKRFPQLTGVTLNGCRITDEGLDHLRQLKDLKRIELWDCFDITDVGISRLWQVPTLKSVSLRNFPRITDASLDRIGKLGRLLELRLDRCPLLTDEGLAGLKESPLQYLIISNCSGITGSGLRLLKDNALKSVTFYGPVYSDKLVPCLESLEHTARIELYKTSVTKPGADQLRRALPHCDVRLRDD
jgi:hypothetical protein